MVAGDAALLRTPLYEEHRRLGGRLVDFAGWEMPVQYAGILAEHQAVRTACGLFDLSHMGRVYVRGPEAVRLASWCTTRDFSRVQTGEAAYALLCRDDGGIIDDVIGYLLGAEEVLFVFNASNRVRDLECFRQQRERKQLQAVFHDATFESALIGIQGPGAEALLQPICTAALADMHGYTFVPTSVLGFEALVARTGYTGEDGFELFVAAQQAAAVWQGLLNQAPAPLPCGLGARDTLRTEAAMPLYGHEIDESTNPYEARLGWAVNLDREEFVGQAALARIKESGTTRRLVGLALREAGVPRPGFPILHEGQAVGSLTSGTHSPTLGHGIGLGYVPAGLDQPGQPLAIEMRGRLISAEVVRLPFVPHRSRSRRRAAV